VAGVEVVRNLRLGMTGEHVGGSCSGSIGQGVARRLAWERLQRAEDQRTAAPTALPGVDGSMAVSSALQNEHPGASVPSWR